MKANKKFIIAIAVMAMVVCLAVGGLVGVFAASQQAVTSSFDVQYRIGQNIAGKVSATYQVYGSNAVAMKTAEGEPNVIFNTTDPSKTGEAAYALSAEATEIALSPEATSVVFTYTFENTGATNMKITLTDAAKRDNVTVTYGVTDNDEATTDSELNATAGFNLAAGKVANVTITVEVTAVNLSSAYYTSTTGTAISWALAHAGV